MRKNQLIISIILLIIALNVIHQIFKWRCGSLGCEVTGNVSEIFWILIGCMFILLIIGIIIASWVVRTKRNIDLEFQDMFKKSTDDDRYKTLLPIRSIRGLYNNRTEIPENGLIEGKGWPLIIENNVIDKDFPVINKLMFQDWGLYSIQSVDIGDPAYQTKTDMYEKLKEFVDGLAGFAQNGTIDDSMYDAKFLIVFVPGDKQINPGQLEAIQNVLKYTKTVNSNKPITFSLQLLSYY